MNQSRVTPPFNDTATSDSIDHERLTPPSNNLISQSETPIQNPATKITHASLPIKPNPKVAYDDTPTSHPMRKFPSKETHDSRSPTRASMQTYDGSSDLHPFQKSPPGMTHASLPPKPTIRSSMKTYDGNADLPPKPLVHPPRRRRVHQETASGGVNTALKRKRAAGDDDDTPEESRAKKSHNLDGVPSENGGGRVEITSKGKRGDVDYDDDGVEGERGPMQARSADGREQSLFVDERAQ